MFYFSLCISIFNSLLAQLVKYDVHTTHKIKFIHAICYHILLFYSCILHCLVSFCDIQTQTNKQNNRVQLAELIVQPVKSCPSVCLCVNQVVTNHNHCTQRLVIFLGFILPPPGQFHSPARKFIPDILTVLHPSPDNFLWGNAFHPSPGHFPRKFPHRFFQFFSWTIPLPVCLPSSRASQRIGCFVLLFCYVLVQCVGSAPVGISDTSFIIQFHFVISVHNT